MNTALDIHIPISESIEGMLRLSHVFQPIVSLKDNELWGFESLLRSEVIHSPEVLFSLASKQNKLLELDKHSVSKCISTYNQVFQDKKNKPFLSINVFPSTLAHASFPMLMSEVLSRVELQPNRIVFEINEAENIQDVSTLQKRIQFLKAEGFMIALDDLGKGQSSLRMALELEPDSIKIDRFFCIDLENSPKKQRLLDWLISYFKAEGISVTLEGIETREQLMMAKQMGIDFGQGYFLGRPEPIIGKTHIWR